MIDYIEIDGTEYPFFFSFRAVFSFMNGQNIMTLEDMDKQVNLEFDSMLMLYEQASKKGAKKDDSDKVLTAEQIEDAIDEDPHLFIKLQELFNNSKVVKAITEEETDEEKEGTSTEKK